MRRKLSAPAWRFPRRMTLKQWSVLTASGTLIWRRRNARCWNIGAIARTHAAAARSAASFRTRVFGSASGHAAAERAGGGAGRPLRALLSLGSLKGAEGLWLF